MDIAAAFKYVFADEGWKEKWGIAAALSMVPVLNLALGGYKLQLVRNAADGHRQPMPTWNDLGRMFIEGLLLFAALCIYSLPLFVLLGGLVSLGLLAFALVQDAEQLLVALPVVLGIGGLALLLLVVYVFVMGLVTPAITVQLARTGRFGSCFALGEMVALVRRNTADYVLVWGVGFAITSSASVVLSPVLSALSAVPMVGQMLSVAVVVIAYVYVMLVTGHLIGQLLSRAR